MIVDAEVYYDPKFKLADKEGFDLLRTQLDEAGVDRAIVFPKVSTMNTDNEGLREVVARDSRLVPCVSINPQYGDDATNLLRRAVDEWGFKGLKLMPVIHAFRAASKAADHLLETAESLNLPVTIHSGNFFCHPLDIAETAARFPRVRFIMDHMGYRYHVLEAILGAERCPNLFLATTAVFEPHFVNLAVQRVGAHRVIFGSNAPMVLPRLQIDVIRALKLPREDEAMILGETAAELYSLA